MTLNESDNKNERETLKKILRTIEFKKLTY